MARIDIGKILGAVLPDIIEASLDKEAEKTTNSLDPKDVAKVAPKVSTDVKKAVVDELQDVVDNQTNQEPWYKSRVLRGAAWVALSTAVVAYKDLTDGTMPDEVTLGGYVSTIFGALYVIYGRLTGAGTPAI